MTIPISLTNQLDSLSTTLKVSRSSLVTEILQDTLPNLIEIMSQLSEHGPETNEPLARNPEKVRSYLDTLKTVIDQQKTQFDFDYNTYVSTSEGSKNGH